MIDKESFVLSRERVEWLLKPFTSICGRCGHPEKLHGRTPDSDTDCMQYTSNSSYCDCVRFNITEKEREWLLGRELLYCEFVKDATKFHEDIKHSDFVPKWSELGLGDAMKTNYPIKWLVVRLEESRSD